MGIPVFPVTQIRDPSIRHHEESRFLVSKVAIWDDRAHTGKGRMMSNPLSDWYQRFQTWRRQRNVARAEREAELLTRDRSHDLTGFDPTGQKFHKN
jgi:hypothetical protein